MRKSIKSNSRGSDGMASRGPEPSPSQIRPWIGLPFDVSWKRGDKLREEAEWKKGIRERGQQNKSF